MAAVARGSHSLVRQAVRIALGNLSKTKAPDWVTVAVSKKLRFTKGKKQGITCCTGVVHRQEYLETFFSWMNFSISHKKEQGIDKEKTGHSVQPYSHLRVPAFSLFYSRAITGDFISATRNKLKFLSYLSTQGPNPNMKPTVYSWDGFFLE